MDFQRVINFLPISRNLLTAGMPSAEQLAQLDSTGVEVVINLACSDSQNAIENEEEILSRQGIEYWHIPVIWEHPTLADLGLFFDAMNKNQGRKIFIHCVLNMRVSVFVYLYRVLQEHTRPEAAQLDLQKIWEPNPTWQAFMKTAFETNNP
jgi:protein tyrosine phosphatase (PTP) superfamily phosphohydrolase (DUF442 family)